MSIESNPNSFSDDQFDLYLRAFEDAGLETTAILQLLTDSAEFRFTDEQIVILFPIVLRKAALLASLNKLQSVAIQGVVKFGYEETS